MAPSEFIHRYIPARNGSKRVLLLLHGTGGDENDLLSLGRDLDPDAALLSPRGKVLENGAPRFFRRFAEGVFDEEDVIARANELAGFLRSAAAEYGFAADAMTAVGYSNGANIAAAMMLLGSAVFAEAILFRAMVVLSNPSAVNLDGKRALLCAGRRDPIIPLENVEALAALLSGAGADVTLQVQEAAHGLIAKDLVDAKAWLRR